MESLRRYSNSDAAAAAAAAAANAVDKKLSNYALQSLIRPLVVLCCLSTLSTQPYIPPGVAKSSTSLYSLGRSRQCHLYRVAGNAVRSHIWHVSFRSGEARCELLYTFTLLCLEKTLHRC